MDRLISKAQMRVITLCGMIIAIVFSLWAGGSLELLRDHITRRLEHRHPADLAATITLYDDRGVIQRVIGLDCKDMLQLREILERENVKGD